MNLKKKVYKLKLNIKITNILKLLNLIFNLLELTIKYFFK